MATRIKLRRDTAANWLESNPILAQGETGFETDTRMFKLGNGATRWADLKYAVTGNLKITDDTIHGDGVVSVSSGMGDRSNWVLTVSAKYGDGTSDAWITAVAYDSMGNAFTAGLYGSPTNDGNSGMFLTKTDANGQVMFSNFYDEMYAFGFGMIVDKNDDVILTLGEYASTSADTVLVKVSGVDGTPMWQKYLADTDPASDDVALCVDIDPSNNVIIAGTTATSSNYDFWVAKFRGDTGAPIWQRQYDSDGCTDTATGIAVDSQGNIGVAGSSYGPGQFLGIFKLNGVNGNVLWQTKVINMQVQANEEEFSNAWVNGDLFSSDICVDSNNDFYFNLTGVYCNPFTVAGIHKVTSAGLWSWSKVVSYAGFFSGSSSLICDSENNVYLSSTLWDYRPQNESNSVPSYSTVITKFNATGRKIWGKSLMHEKAEVYAGAGYGPDQIGVGLGQTIAVNDDYILVGGGYYEAYQYDPVDQNWYNQPFLAQLDKAGTDFVKDGWIFKDNFFPIFDMAASTVDDRVEEYIRDLTVATPDILVTTADVGFYENIDTYSLVYISTSRVETMTLDGARLHLPVNGGLSLDRKHIGHYTSIGKFDLDGNEGNNRGGNTWINDVTADDEGNVYASGGWYTRGASWNDSDNYSSVPLVWKIDSEGAIVWTAGNNLNQFSGDMMGVVYNAADNTILTLGHDNELDGHEGFNITTLDAGSGKMRSILHVHPTGETLTGNSEDMLPTNINLLSDGTTVVTGSILNTADEFANVTGGAAGLTGSTSSGVLVINKSVFVREGFDTEYPTTDGYWYIGDIVITHVNSYENTASVNTTVDGIGSDATFTVIADPATNAYTVAVSAGGTNYSVDDTLKVIGSLLGGTDVTNDAVLTVTGVDNGAITGVTVTGTGQTTKIKLDDGVGNYTQAGTYTVWHYTNTDSFIWTTDWHLAFGGIDGNDYTEALAIDSNDNIVVGGYSDSLGLGPATTDYNNYYSQNAFVAKFDKNGTKLWAKSVDGHEGGSTVWGAVVDHSDNIYAVFKNQYYPHLIKLTSSGDFVWMVKLRTYGYASGTYSVTIDDEENIIIAGQDRTPDSQQDRVGYSDQIQLAKFDRDGNTLWQRLLWSNNGMRTSFRDYYGNNLGVAGDKLIWGGVSNAWNDDDDAIALLAQLPIGGTGLGRNGNYTYDMVEVTVDRWETNDTFGGDILIVRDVAARLGVRNHKIVSEPYGLGQYAGGDSSSYFSGASGPMTIYGNLDGKVAHILEEGGGDITGVKEIVFEDGTRQSTSSQDIPQVDISITNRGDDNYWLRLEDRGHHIYMEDVQGVDIYIPDALQVPFPVGTSIVIVTGASSRNIYGNGGNNLMHAAGLNTSSYGWTMPQWSMVTLLKIHQGYNTDGSPTSYSQWMIAGPGLEVY
jgi:hypothetical protein